MRLRSTEYLKDVLLIIGAYVLSRALYMLLGVRFNFRPLDDHWQYLDPALLRGQLLESLWYLHAQPPLFNALCGLALKIFPDRGYRAFYGLFLLLGLASTIGMFLLMRRLGALRDIALALTLVFVFNPVFVLYEHYFFYTHVIMTLLCLSTVCIERFLATERTAWLIAFFGAALVICLTRASFHLVWLLVITIALWAMVDRRHRKKVLVVALVPLLLTSGWYAKNWYLFGHFASSTWMGMSTANSYANTGWLSPEQLGALSQQGVISPTSTLPSFSPLDDYQRYMSLPPPTGHAALDQINKASGGPNYNHLAYIRISDQYFVDTWRVIRLYPWLLPRQQATSWLVYFRPASEYYANLLGENNLARVRWIDTAYKLGYYLKFRVDVVSNAETYSDRLISWRWFQAVSLTLLFGTVTLACYIPWYAREHWRAGARYIAIPLLYAWLNIFYSALVGNSIELGENNRFRLETEPLWIVLLAIVLTRIVIALRARRRRI